MCARLVWQALRAENGLGRAATSFLILESDYV